MIEPGAYVIVRSKDAGVFAGCLTSKIGTRDVVILSDARRIWYWAGAASISELASRGTSKPEGCKFPAAVSEVVLYGVIEIIATTREAEQSIRSVPVWTE